MATPSTCPILPNPRNRHRHHHHHRDAINSLSPRQILSFVFTSQHLRPFSASSSTILDAPKIRVRVAGKTDSEARQKLNDNWLASLSCATRPPQLQEIHASGSHWVIGIDPDIHGALALLKRSPSDSFSAQVFDSPHLPVLVGGRVRKRLDTKSMVELLRSFDAPNGTTAYIEQSAPFPKDGKQGWWSGGFGYGLWIGMLVAMGFSVVPVSSGSWKRNFELSGSSCTKDDSRRVASTLFPPLSSMLKRKKDHGRAEALLIAAYGRGMKMGLDETIALDKLGS